MFKSTKYTKLPGAQREGEGREGAGVPDILKVFLLEVSAYRQAKAAEPIHVYLPLKQGTNVEEMWKQ